MNSFLSLLQKQCANKLSIHYCHKCEYWILLIKIQIELHVLELEWPACPCFLS